jgi:hypothetical protein
MKKFSCLLVLSILLAGGVAGVMTAPAYAQVFAPPPPPPHPILAPWVGPNTPWVHYNGDWFLNGVLYYFFGNKYGWAPYYAYAPTYIVRPNSWYAPSWNAWYQKHPVYWQNFTHQYPYWRAHQPGHVYGQNFYNQYHRGQGGGWQKGFHGATYNRPQPEMRNPNKGPGVPPDARHKGPPPGHENSPGHQPGSVDRNMNNRNHPPDKPGYGPPPTAQPGKYQRHGQPATEQPVTGREAVPPRRPSE